MKEYISRAVEMGTRCYFVNLVGEIQHRANLNTCFSDIDCFDFECENYLAERIGGSDAWVTIHSVS